MQWTDIDDIAIELLEAHPNVDPLSVNFVDLRNWVMALPEFDDDPKRCGEKILEAIQAAWVEERAW
jgi:FeS assembly protein IscX